MVSLTMEAPFLSHLATMADTGLLVARHGPILSSAVLLPPGVRLNKECVFVNQRFVLCILQPYSCWCACRLRSASSWGPAHDKHTHACTHNAHTTHNTAGAAVLELLPYKWDWRSMSSLYYNMTQSTGVLHHWAWRPTDARWCK